ncbi:MAG: hypothetical protein GQ474_10585 [Sulfurimonas sp.]|nr:hypothetical protein [Sulfurimonas sp.]
MLLVIEYSQEEFREEIESGNFTNRLYKEIKDTDLDKFVADKVLISRHGAEYFYKILEANKALKLKWAIDEFTRGVEFITAGIPTEEQSTWTKQEQEARAYIEDSTAITILIDALSTARGVDKTYLVNKVIEKADLFSVAIGTLAGERQKKEDEILEQYALDIIVIEK